MGDSTSQKKILLVDDDADFRSIVARALTTDGYVVVEANSGEDGLTLLASEHPDLVLLDIMMPGMSGADFLRRVHDGDYSDPRPQIIMLTNLSGVDEISGSLALGAYGYVVKADDGIEEVRQTVRSALTRTSV